MQNAVMARLSKDKSPLVFHFDGGVFTETGECSLSGSPVGDYTNCFIFPGFTDVHVHLREPGFSYKETIRTGTLAAAAGGFTAVCSMPNLKPVPDSVSSMREQLDIIEKDAAVGVFPFAAITRGESGEVISDMEALAPLCAGFSDDGRGVMSDDLMEAAMRSAAKLNKPIVAHCEDATFSQNDKRSEFMQLKRDIELVKKTGCTYHMCHLSCRESLDIIREAKRLGLDVTCETAPHYLLLDDTMTEDDGRFKMNPPIRTKADRLALLEGIADGSIDMIATDHAPHSAEEKTGGFAGSLNGIVGLETAFPVLYTGLVRAGIISLDKLIELLHGAPKKRFGIGGELKRGESADFTVFDLEDKFEIRPDRFVSKGKSTPFSGTEVFGRCRLTVVKGRTVWQSEK